MFRFHLTRNLRSLAFLLTFAAMIAAMVGLWWANHTGLPGPWRATIEQEAAKQGAFIKIGSLSYIPFRGVVATDVRIYSEPLHIREISRLEAVVLDFDKTKLARGDFHLNKIELDRAKMVLPVDPDNPDSEILNVSDASGALFMPGDRRLEIRDAHGKIAGIEVALNARLIGYQSDGRSQSEDSNLGKRRELLARVISELEKWSFDENQAPVIDITIEGDVNSRSSINATVSLEVKNMEKNGHRLDDISAKADMAGDILTISSLRAADRRGSFQGHIDYNLLAKEGRFDLVSSLEIPSLLTGWLGLPEMTGIQVTGRQEIRTEGEFQLDGSNKPRIQATGHARCESVKLKTVPFDAVELSFSWRENRTYLRDLQLIRADGKAAGKAMIEWPLVRLELHTTLPLPVYRPFFVGQPLEKVLNDFTEGQNASVDVSLEGGFDVTNRYSWAYTGSGEIKGVAYRGVPVNSAGCKFSVNHRELDFHDGTVVFDYSKYSLHKAFNSEAEGTAKVGRIRYDAPAKMVQVEDVRGKIWAAPMVRFFAPKVADSLEQYRFHHPPEMKASGVVDVTPQGRTSLDVSFRSDKAADYVFLGSNVTLAAPSGRVSIQGERVLISDLQVEAFGGPVAGDISYLGKGRLEGDLSWTKLSIPALASAYGFQMKGGGEVTGRINFLLKDNKVETMSGTGLLALENAELFSVPMFGPLTPLIAGVLNDENAGMQRAKDAFCTFAIKDGILSSGDFQTSTNSLNFAGNGSVDMKQQTVDMTMRLNARGLLGILTRPLRPFSGLFQFHGTGPLKETKWESMRFTEPPVSENEILLAPPKAKPIPTTP